MTLEEILQNRKQSAVAVFHRYRLAVAKGEVKTIFVEGYLDRTFYSRFLDGSRFSGADVRLTFGKRNMDLIAQWFYAEGYDDQETVFIRDSDFDRWLGLLPTGRHLFVTCGYSVENYVCSEITLRRFFYDVFALDPAEVDIPAEIQRFSHALREVFLWMAPLVGAILFAVRGGRTLDLDALPLGPIFRTALQGGHLPEIEGIDVTPVGLAAGDFTEESREMGAAFVNQDPFRWLRGHYLIAFAATFIADKHQEFLRRRKAGEIHQLNRRISTDFSAGAVFERLTPFTPPPEALLAVLG